MRFCDEVASICPSDASHRGREHAAPAANKHSYFLGNFSWERSMPSSPGGS